MKRRLETSDSTVSPLRRKAVGVGLAVAAIAVAAWAMSDEPEAIAVSALAAAPPPSFVLHKSSWSEAPAAEQPAAAPQAGFTPALKRDDEAKRLEEARERWQNLDIAVTDR